MMRSTSERHAMMVLGGMVLLGMARLGGATSFTDVTSTAGVGDTGGGQGTAWGDYDGDGDLDLYVANYEANTLYQNDLGVTSITLVVKPLTAAGAPSIFGAVTLATSDGNVVALRSLDGGSGYLSQNR